MFSSVINIIFRSVIARKIKQLLPSGKYITYQGKYITYQGKYITKNL